MDDNTIVDPSKVTIPDLKFTTVALNQLRLILENDFTLKGKYLRILASGKGCDGFTYSIRFTEWEEADFLVPILHPEIGPENNQDKKDMDKQLQVLMDPFTAFYLQKVSVDYVQDFANNSEGFTVTNENQKDFSGKFWRQDAAKVPPLKKELDI
jgi:iron-sulfur cluster insertion protein